MLTPIVPEPVIVPPVEPEPAVTEVTVPPEPTPADRSRQFAPVSSQISGVLIVPATSSFEAGAVVPTPTLPVI